MVPAGREGAGVAESLCSHAIAAARAEGLDVLHDFGPVVMNFSVHVPIEAAAAEAPFVS
jgi:hypothetical protein